MELANPFHGEKLLLHIGRVRELAAGRLVAPQTIEVDLTDGACNQGCVYCCFSSGEGKVMDRIDPDRLLAALAEAYDMGTRAVELVGGGEPTAHPQVAQIVQGIRSIGAGDMTAGIITNGVLAERLLPVADQMEFIRVSLDTADPETYRVLHKAPPAHFRKVIKNLGALRAAITAPAEARRLGIGYLVVPPYNHRTDQILEGAALARELELDYITYRPCELDEAPPPEHWAEAQEAIGIVRRTSGGRTAVFGGTGNRWDTLAPGGHPSGPCDAKPVVAVIQANGDVAHCILYRNQRELRIGNIYETSFRELWFSEEHERTWKAREVSGCPNPCKLYGYNEIVRRERAGLNPPPPDRAEVAHHNYV